MTFPSVTVQITPESKPSTPSWMGEVATFAQVLTHEGILAAIAEQVRFAPARFGRYETLDFVAVLLGYAVSGEPTLLAFYERLAPWAEPFMALFGRDRLPHRSTFSRFLAALDQPAVEALRTLFQKDLLARKPFPSPGGLFDRTGGQWLVVDVDSKLGETRKVFKVKSTKSARNVEIHHSRIAESASRAALLGCKMFIAETIKKAFHTLQALVKVIIRVKSSIEALDLIIVAQFALILSVSPQNSCSFHPIY